MSKNIDMDTLYKTADKFIDLANILAQEDKSGTVGSAFRFAAARYSAFELSLSNRDLAKEKEELKEELLKDYALMLDENLDVYIRHLREKAQQEKSQSKLKVFS
ncbi:DUF3144 domain-containing protein [Candidatus Sulfurimonas marisnigri]|uniref:DUF3144 domain-containing protein n=1 Tax=Candidatus Sulfurimonas marisnigri TaxID=2740405 RepID=A0A7S7M1S6_9BACT|nr:DUF3144 domain-containing protein [Candidatus Sulfurimonas marisnigri]QOY54933.1 DUF3144 domain-containing protein [Candidatus Sulfurimonas marisnigri]